MKTLYLLPGLLGTALLASARTPAPPVPGRCYVGLQTAGNQYELHYQAGLLAASPEVIRVAPWLLSVGLGAEILPQMNWAQLVGFVLAQGTATTVNFVVQRLVIFKG